MKSFKYFFFILCSFFILLIVGCSKGDEEPEFIDPSDIDALSQVLIFPDGTNRSTGVPPSPSSSTTAPTVDNPLNLITSSNGSTAPLEFSYDQVDGNLAGCYVQIPGTNNYVTVPYNSNSGTSGSLAVPVGIPANILEGSFDLNFCVYDNSGQVSNVVSTQVNVLRLGTGSLQISLSWNTETDQDLFVNDPEGTAIYYSNRFSPSGGQLDRDDTDGFGPENIFWLDDAPDGEYQVFVNDFEGTIFENTVYVTVTAPDKSKRFTATTRNGSTAEIVTIRKSNDNYEF